MTGDGALGTPGSEFLDALHARARRLARRIVLPEATDPRVREARDRIERLGIAEVVWLEHPEKDERLGDVAAHVYSRRKKKGITAEDAMKQALDPLWFAASLVALGHADASVAGAAHATADVLRAGIHCVGTAPGIDFVSSMFLLVRGAEVLSYADCGVIPDPDPDQLAAIASATADNHARFTGQLPRVAFLSFSTRGSAEHPKIEKMRAALRAFRKLQPDAVADGELQFDAAYVPEVAARKCADSPLGGRANVFVFPDLDAGNIAYKITQRLGGFHAFGPLIQGLARPCMDLSRGCNADDIVNVAAAAVVMTENQTLPRAG
jgi:phosphate acetyltransferase